MEYLENLGFDRKKIRLCGWYVVDNDLILSIYQNALLKRSETIKNLNLKSKNFIYVGRLSPEKNLKTLINAFTSVKASNRNSYDWGLIIVGDGPLRDELKDLVKRNNLDAVCFLCGKSWRDVYQYYALSDVFVLSSTSKPWGLVVNEAMICGLPIIVSKRAGSYFDLVKEGENGFGFDPLNQEELETIMLKFVNEEVGSIMMGEKSKEIIKNYTPENMAKNMFHTINKFF